MCLRRKAKALGHRRDPLLEGFRGRPPPVRAVRLDGAETGSRVLRQHARSRRSLGIEGSDPPAVGPPARAYVCVVSHHRPVRVTPGTDTGKGAPLAFRHFTRAAAAIVLTAGISLPLAHGWAHAAIDDTSDETATSGFL